LNDVGVYSVLAENKAGSDRTDGEIFIIKDISIDNAPIVDPTAFNYLNRPEPVRKQEVEKHFPPKVIVPLTSSQVPEGKSILLACKIEGSPKPTLRWYKNSVILPASTRFTPTYDLSTGIATLKIPDAVLFDSGNYEVIAENDHGSARTACDLLVQNLAPIDKTPIVDPNAFKYVEPQRAATPRKPSNIDEATGLPNVAPNIVVPLSDVFTKEGEDGTFLCKIFARPKPTIRWLKNGSSLNESMRFT
jgi:hypothetical protein